MSIVAVRSRTFRAPLTRPYAIAGGHWDQVEFALCEIEDASGRVGYGAASPAEEVTGESFAVCARMLERARPGWLVGREADQIEHHGDDAHDLESAPAARAALDMALFDLRAKSAGMPLVEQLGRVHSTIATSITIGLKSPEETLEEAREYLGRGFRLLKLKVGVDVDLDVERFCKLREAHGARVVLRADANQGYDVPALERFLARTDALDLELLEQPLPRGEDAALHRFPEAARRKFVADESVHGSRDLERMIAAGSAFGVVNVKLMKCGGIAEALRMANIAERAGIRLMWGCMDESVLGIAAALHVALACPATRYLDLDGSFDLAHDPFSGGFALDGDRLQTLGRPGLGARPS
jgi:L-alanine-DL-glutamate epimerase-like enolase superfamily enzyme